MVRDKQLNIRLTQQERRALEIVSQREGQGLSELIRKLIREEIEKRGLHTVGLVDFLYSQEVQDGNKPLK